MTLDSRVIDCRREWRGTLASPSHTRQFLRLFPLRPGDVLVAEDPEGHGEEDDDVRGHDEEAVELTGQSGSGESD